jgi:hypothetical protein
MGEERKVYKILVGKPEGKNSLGKLMCRWYQNGDCLGGCGVELGG